MAYRRPLADCHGASVKTISAGELGQIPRKGVNTLTGTASDVGEVLGRGNYGANGMGSLVLRVSFIGHSESQEGHQVN